MYKYMHMCMYIYIYRERERQRPETREKRAFVSVREARTLSDCMVLLHASYCRLDYIAPYYVMHYISICYYNYVIYSTSSL